ncbi:SDR family oxidoreductase [Microbacterium sp. E-13]|uniref:SDR family oxidoreductase n=1 Tax=Microbacterium sp. E-13 TaxID=3404048 RepID=UPI003CF6A4F7
MSETRRLAVVAGATSGMGWEIARDLSADHEVVALGRSASALAELDALPGVSAMSCDITSAAEREALASRLERVDVLVHAASGDTGATGGVDEWEAMVGMFLIAPAEMTRLMLPQLRASRGTVVFIGSGASTKPTPGMPLYTAAKHGLRGYADTLRIAEAPLGVRVATVAPGPTDTPGLRVSRSRSGAPYEPERYIRPSSVAGAVRFVVDAPDDVHLTDVAVRPRVELSR